MNNQDLFDYAKIRQNDGRVYLAINAVMPAIKVGHTHNIVQRQMQYDLQDPNTHIFAHTLGSIEEEQAIHDKWYRATTGGRHERGRKKRDNDRGDLHHGEEWWNTSGYILNQTRRLISIWGNRQDCQWVGPWNVNNLELVLNALIDEQLRVLNDRNQLHRSTRSVVNGPWQ